MTYEEAIEQTQKVASKFDKRMFLYPDKPRGDGAWFISNKEWSDWVYTCWPGGTSIERLGP
jgi:hypothetical protein